MSLVKPLLTLTQMPWNIKNAIVDSLDTVTKLSLRQCSKDFKNRVSKSQLTYKDLQFEVNTDSGMARVTLTIDKNLEERLDYRHRSDGYVLKNLNLETVKNGNYILAAVAQFTKVLRNPKVLIGSFKVNFARYDNTRLHLTVKNLVINRLHTFLVNLPHQIAVRDLILRFDGTQEDILNLLPYLKPGILRMLNVSAISHVFDLDLEQIADSEQWKGARSLRLDFIDMKLPKEKWSHFSSTTVHISDPTFDQIGGIYEIFASSAHWESCLIMGRIIEQSPFIRHFARFGTVKRHFAKTTITIPIAKEKNVEVCITDFSIDFITN